MPRTRVVKQLVCSECGQPLRREPVTTAVVDEVAPVPEDDADEDMVVEDQDGLVETLVETGPVCPRCAGYR